MHFGQKSALLQSTPVPVPPVTNVACRERAWEQVHTATQTSLSSFLHGKSFHLQLWAKHLNQRGDQVLWKLRIDLICLVCVFSGSSANSSPTWAWPKVFFFAHTWLSSLPLCPSLSWELSGLKTHSEPPGALVAKLWKPQRSFPHGHLLAEPRTATYISRESTLTSRQIGPASISETACWGVCFFQEQTHVCTQTLQFIGSSWNSAGAQKPFILTWWICYAGLTLPITAGVNVSLCSVPYRSTKTALSDQLVKNCTT